MDRKEIRLFFLQHGYLLITAAWLITFAFLANNYWVYYSSPRGVQSTIEKSIQQREKAFDSLTTDWPVMEQLLRRNYSPNLLSSLLDKKLDFYFFVFNNGFETFWNTNLAEPGPGTYNLPDGSSLIRLKIGYFEMIKKKIGGIYPGDQVAIALIPIRITYFTTNEYLPDEFYGKPGISGRYKINTQNLGLPVRSSTGKILFSLYYNSNGAPVYHSWISTILKTLAAICALIFLNLMAVFIAQKTNKWYGLLFLVVTIVLLRLISYYYPIPFNFREYGLFDPKVYASNAVLRSLGDLFINGTLLFWIILFFREHFEDIRMPPLSRKFNYFFTFLFCLLLFMSAQFLSDVVRSLVVDSKISFDVTNFRNLTWYSFVGFLTLGIIVFTFFFFSRIINRFLYQLTGNQNNIKYAILAISGIVWLLFRIHNPHLGYSLVLMVWLIIYLILMDIIGLQANDAFDTIPFIFFLLMLTLTTTGILVYYNNRQEEVNRETLVRNLAHQNDRLTPSILGDKLRQIQHDSLVTEFFQKMDPRVKNTLIEHLQTDYFSGYLSKFDIRIFTFDDDGRPVFNRDTSDIFYLNNIIDMKSRPTNVPDLYYYESSFNNFSYIDKKEILNSTGDRVIGYMFFILTPKVLKRETLYPALLVENNRIPLKYSDEYSYAIYNHDQLVTNYNDYPFRIRLLKREIPKQKFTFREENGYSQLWYIATPQKTIIMVKRSPNFFEAITLFAYMFCIFLLIAGIYRMLDLVIRARMKWSVFRHLLEINIRKQIHGTIIFIVVFAFLILAVTAIPFFIGLYNKNHRDQLSRNVNVIAAEVTGDALKNIHLTGKGEYLFDPAFHDRLSGSINRIADSHEVDINMYDLEGNLQITTQPLIYEEKLLSSKINPEAYYQLRFRDRVQFIQNETIGKLNFLSAYLPVRSENGTTIAYLNVPYFASQTNLNLEISNFLITLINLNAFIFLLSGMLALIITNSITRSFSLIGEKLKEVTLLKGNNPIEWKRNDEIGLLVREYNNMVQKLEASAASMAKTEREGAWREMAKQVAHEIKNPLTSMKLSLQYLQRAYLDDSPRLQSLSENVAKTLIEQIEHLSHIAEDFAAFANISPSSNEKILLNDVLGSVITLYQGDQRHIILYDPPDQQYYVVADKTEMNRLFTNLLQNAVQSIPEDRRGFIEIETIRDGSQVIVMVSDNGCGIPDEICSRIFMPNFTTKNSGTGLGLAMCKNIIEHAKGEIRFETKVGKGTVFYVKLPLAET
ncbi:MAG TPA: HAMP domain-containing sensor histidine kinase [Chitinophagaceae bacterium]|nr:HAMP domain-containing sensor histidine kinase [Chitinophagaceae bacterium]